MWDIVFWMLNLVALVCEIGALLAAVAAIFVFGYAILHGD